MMETTNTDDTKITNLRDMPLPNSAMPYPLGMMNSNRLPLPDSLMTLMLPP